MAIWAIADLHLSFGVPDKTMDLFGPQWKNHPEKIATSWRESISPDDLVLIAGDISWAKHLEDAIPDLQWIERLPGTKVLIKGNHDYWWNSLSKVKSILPPSCHVIQHDSWMWHDVAIAGARLWDIPGLRFGEEVPTEATLSVEAAATLAAENEKIYRRELGRLEMSLKSLNPRAKIRLAMTHYPPVGLHLEETDASRLFEKYHIQTCVFGHLHHLPPTELVFGSRNGVDYRLTACDYLDFKPLRLF